MISVGADGLSGAHLGRVFLEDLEVHWNRTLERLERLPPQGLVLREGEVGLHQAQQLRLHRGRELSKETWAIDANGFILVLPSICIVSNDPSF